MPEISKSKLIRLQKSLKTDQRIADELGVTSTTICNWRKAYGIPTSIVRDPLRNGKIVKAYLSGDSVINIAGKFNLSLTQTYRVIRAGIKGKRRKNGGPCVGSWPTPKRRKVMYGKRRW